MSKSRLSISSNLLLRSLASVASSLMYVRYVASSLACVFSMMAVRKYGLWVVMKYWFLLSSDTLSARYLM